MSKEKMTRDEFKLACWASGYCSPSQAVEYMGDRQEFTDDDFIEVCRKYSTFGRARNLTKARAKREMQGRLAKHDEQD